MHLNQQTTLCVVYVRLNDFVVVDVLLSHSYQPRIAFRCSEHIFVNDIFLIFVVICLVFVFFSLALPLTSSFFSASLSLALHLSPFLAPLSNILYLIPVALKINEAFSIYFCLNNLCKIDDRVKINYKIHWKWLRKLFHGTSHVEVAQLDPITEWSAMHLITKRRKKIEKRLNGYDIKCKQKCKIQPNQLHRNRWKREKQERAHTHTYST